MGGPPLERLPAVLLFVGSIGQADVSLLGHLALRQWEHPPSLATTWPATGGRQPAPQCFASPGPSSFVPGRAPSAPSACHLCPCPPLRPRLQLLGLAPLGQLRAPLAGRGDGG